jgi:hypothetical protein
MIAPDRFSPKAIAWICLVLVLLQSQGCAVATLYRGKPGLDTTGVQPGASRADVETIMGAARREWTTQHDVRYRVYVYNGGVEGSVGDAIAFGVMDVISVGLWELFYAIHPMPDGAARKITERMAVSYDQSDTVIGVFDHFGDFDVLPDDGRAEGRARGSGKDG